MVISESDREANVQRVLAQCSPVWNFLGWSHVLSLAELLSPPCPSHLRLSLLAALKTDGPGWNSPRNSRIAKSVISGCRTMCISISIYFPTSIIFCGKVLQYLVLLVLMVIIFLVY
jgi:hypothetical protein